MSDTPEVTQPKRLAIDTGGCQIIITADNRIVRLEGISPYVLTYCATIEYSRVGNQKDMFDRFFAIWQMSDKCLRD